MKTKSILHLALIALLALAGCASKPAKPQPAHERGWIGGRYERTKAHKSAADHLFGADHTIFDFPSPLTNSHSTGILTLSLGTNTPAYLAGLREGDLILELGHQPVTNLSGFWHDITGARPGAALTAMVFRNGKTFDYNITVGREKYLENGTLSVTLPGYVEAPHPIATPDAPKFSLVALGYEKNTDSHFEFDSVKQHYKETCHPKAKAKGYDTEWRCWLAIFEVRKGQEILAQEVVPAPAK